jgi:PIN domain nuclease of toxin-antitoxin system
VILVDTHVVVRLAFDQDQLSRKARAAINDTRKNGSALAISDITLLESATLASKACILRNCNQELRLGRHNLKMRTGWAITGNVTKTKQIADRMLGASGFVSQTN